jgi:hypothetical protein
MARTFNYGTKWNDINVGIGFTLGSSAPSLDIITGAIRVYSFDGTGPTNQAYASIELLHDYKEGTDIYPHLHWTPTTAAAGNVKWQLEYNVVSPGDAISGSTTISVVTAAGGIKLTNSEFSPAISGTNRKVGDQIMFRLFRNSSDGDDTYADPAGLVSFGVHYQVDDIGSKNRFSN